MAILDFAYLNYEHGGLVGHRDELHVGDGYRYDYTKLVRIMGEEDRWPDVLVLGECDRYEFWGGRGAWEAIDAMAEAGGRTYTWLPCALPRGWGPFAPAIFVDTQTVRIKRFYSPHAPDFANRTRNLFIARPARGDQEFRLVPIHGDPYVPEYRAMDAEALWWLARQESIPTLLAGDFNEPLSGPAHEPTDLNDPAVFDKPWATGPKVDLHHGRIIPPLRRSTGSLDYLCGWWDHERNQRVNGIGFHDVCELHGIATPTDQPRPNRLQQTRQGVALDHILVNDAARQLIVPASVRVHEPIDPQRPDSNHKRLSVALRF